MEYYISSDKDKLDVPKIHQEVKSTYWGGYRTPEMTQKTIDACLCFGVYSNEDEQVGFARVLTDKVVFAYLMDVIIFEPYKGKGLGKKLVATILEHPDIKVVHTVGLKTMDAHGLYEPLGFKKIGDSTMWMAMDNAKYDYE